MPGPSRFEELITALQVPHVHAVLAAIAQQVVPGQVGPADAVVALAWATPDIARTMEQVVAPFVPAERDRSLGAIAMCVGIGPVQVVLEQPEAEAGLSAYLSRYGEGTAVLYLDRPRFMPSARTTGRPPKPVATPLGRRGWLLPHVWPWGPFVIALESNR